MSRLQERLKSPGPKRILSLDGGGIRGYLTLQILRKIEEIVKDRCGQKTRLCDYFDLIGGTSTGSILAAGIAAGISLDKLDELYVDLGQDIFKPKWFRKGLLWSKFKGDNVTRALDSIFPSWTVDDERILTGLAICTKRMDTGSPWVLTNLPDATYASSDGRLLLTQVVRASTAAPHYFDPEEITIYTRGGDPVKGAFVDGGMSPYVNPALQLLLASRLEGFGLQWRLGAEQLLLVSVGTGKRRTEFDTSAEEIMDKKAAMLALESAVSMMEDSSDQAEMLLQLISDSPTKREIDSLVGDLSNDSLGDARLSYLRYDVEMNEGWLKENLGIDWEDEELKEIHKMDSAKKMRELEEIGEAAGKKLVDPTHFLPVFDV